MRNFLNIGWRARPPRAVRKVAIQDPKACVDFSPRARILVPWTGQLNKRGANRANSWRNT